LLLVGFVATFWWWIAATLGGAVLFCRAAVAGVLRGAPRRCPVGEACRALARADEQHAWVLAGDDRGIYGNYTPKQID
jgi:hypothetical protein